MNDTVVKDSPGEQPIGYWLNRCDQAITNTMNRRLANCGANRFDWQVLNVVSKNGDVSTAYLYEHLEANADRPTLTTSVKTLLAQGYLHRTDASSDLLRLTESGKDFREQLSKQVSAFRDELLIGITGDEYRITLSVLQRITNNLDLP